MLLICCLLLAINLPADTSIVFQNYQGVVAKMHTSSTAILGFVNVSSASTNVLDAQCVDKRCFSVIAFFFMFIMGVLYLQHKENRLAELSTER